MQATRLERTPFWLSLVAETAGVSHAVIARVQLQSHACADGLAGVIVQVKDGRGQVVGATRWEGHGQEMRRGVTIDLACDLPVLDGACIVGWLEDFRTREKPARMTAPSEAAVQHLGFVRSVKLVLNAPAPVEAA